MSFTDFLEKYKPVFDAEAEAGAAETELTQPPTTETEETDEGTGSGRTPVRKALEKGIETVRKQEADRNKKGQFTEKTRRIAGGAEIDAPAGESEDAETSETSETTVAAPEALSKEAKAEWAKTPKAVQDALIKREADMAKGVTELKTKYADIEQALAPHMNAIRQHNQTPAQAISQLFAWMQALAVNPDVAFPALAKSFGHDIGKFGKPVVPATPEPPATPETQADPALAAFETRMKAFEDQFGKKIIGLEETFQKESAEKTNAVLANWSKDKPHFEKVRQLMAQMLQSGAIPLKDGQVDLDGAYEAAIWASPEVRAEVLAAQEAAKQAEAKKKAEEARKKAQAEADKARKANVSVAGGAPGDASATNSGKKGKSKSIRESLREAIEQIQE